MKDTNTSLLDAVLTLKSRVGNFSAQDYEKTTGKAWNFTYDDMETQFLGENEFKSITYKNKFIEDDYFTFSIPYIFLEEDQDALLDLYLILKEMENYQDKLQNTPFCEEQGLKKLCSKSEKGMQSFVPNLGLGEENEVFKTSWSFGLQAKWNVFGVTRFSEFGKSGK